MSCLHALLLVPSFPVKTSSFRGRARPLRSASNPSPQPPQPTSTSGQSHSLLQRSTLTSSASKPHSLGCVHGMGGSASSLASKARNRNISIQTAGSQMSSSDLCACAEDWVPVAVHTHHPCPPMRTHKHPPVYSATHPSIPLCLHTSTRVPLFIHLSIYPPTQAYIHPPTNPPVYPST